jgi:hypothetical protein
MHETREGKVVITRDSAQGADRHGHRLCRPHKCSQHLCKESKREKKNNKERWMLEMECMLANELGTECSGCLVVQKAKQKVRDGHNLIFLGSFSGAFLLL